MTGNCIMLTIESSTYYLHHCDRDLSNTHKIVSDCISNVHQWCLKNPFVLPLVSLCLSPADRSPCHLGEAPGPCRGLVTRYFFNRATRECQQFYYGGCFGNANNFRNMAECQSKCQNPSKTLHFLSSHRAP